MCQQEWREWWWRIWMQVHGNNGANAQTRLELLYNICRCARRSGGNDDEECKSKCMRPLEASCASNYAGTVDCFSISGLAQLYIYIQLWLCWSTGHTHTHTQTDKQTERQTHTHTIHAQALSSFKLFRSCCRWKIEKCSTLYIICCICNVYCMLYSAYYTVPCILYILYSSKFWIGANFCILCIKLHCTKMKLW